MKRLLFILCLFFSITGCTRTQKNIQTATAKVCNDFNFSNTFEVRRVINTTTFNQKAESFFPNIQRLVYFRDHRTNLCFAYMGNNDYHGGPGMASVPCETVDQYLLNPDETKGNR